MGAQLYLSESLAERLVDSYSGSYDKAQPCSVSREIKLYSYLFVTTYYPIATAYTVLVSMMVEADSM